MSSPEIDSSRYVVQTAALCKTVGMADAKVDILSDVSLAVEDNTSVSISGSSGSGRGSNRVWA